MKGPSLSHALRNLEDLAAADVAFQAWGTNLEETFIAAADATMNVMVEDLAIELPGEAEIAAGKHELDLLFSISCRS